MKRFLFFFFMIFITIGQGLAQVTIEGLVVDNNNEPMPGVTIVLKGTQKGTFTNQDGAFTLANVPEGDILVFS